jgi:hypothetical protein
VDHPTWKLTLQKKMEKKNYYAINVGQQMEPMVIDDDSSNTINISFMYTIHFILKDINLLTTKIRELPLFFLQNNSHTGLRTLSKIYL